MVLPEGFPCEVLAHCGTSLDEGEAKCALLASLQFVIEYAEEEAVLVQSESDLDHSVDQVIKHLIVGNESGGECLEGLRSGELSLELLELECLFIDGWDDQPQLP